MDRTKRAKLWRTLSFSATPLLALAAALLIRTGDTPQQWLGALVGLAAIAAIILPLRMGQRR